jgi:hypothetical protein
MSAAVDFRLKAEATPYQVLTAEVDGRTARSSGRQAQDVLRFI